MVLFLPKVSKPNSVMKGNSLFQDHPMRRCPLIGRNRSRVQTPCKVFFCFLNAYVIAKALQYTDLYQHSEAQQTSAF